MSEEAVSAEVQPRRPMHNLSKSLKIASEHWPDLFGKTPKLPFKVGIFQDLLRDRRERGIDLSGMELRLMLRCYCGLPKYHNAVKAGGMRYDLHGNPVVQVEEKHIANAKAKLFRINKIAKSKA